MRFLISAAILCFLLIAFFVPVSARIAFVHDRTFTVPEVTGSIRQIKFKDLDNDGIPELLTWDASHVILWSAQTDSVLFRFLSDSGSTLAGMTFAEVNGDSVTDIVIATIVNGVSEIMQKASYWKLTAFDGKSGFASESFDTLPDSGMVSPLIASVDFDGQARSKVLFSYSVDIMQTYMGMWEWDDYTGGAILYDHFPDQKAQFNGRLTGLYPIYRSDGVRENLVSTSYNYYHEISGADRVASSQQLAVLSRPNSLSELVLSPSISQWGYDCTFTYSNSNQNEFGCAGELSSADSVDLISQFTWKFGCDGYVQDSLRRLESWRMQADGPVRRWSRDITGTNYSNFMYHPQLPGVFFGFSGDTLLMFSGSDGSIRDRLTEVPTGQRYWDNPYNDSIPRLVVINGTTVSLYHLDIATGVNDDNRNAALPHSFALGNPYPNPFNPSTSIPVATGPGGALTLEVYNIAGQRVAKLYDGEVSAGKALTIRWDTRSVASGVYFAHATLGGAIVTKKLMLLK